jgi:hypothetical protein
MALALREHNALENDNLPPSRNAVLARYRQLREINMRHHHETLKFISGDAVMRQARRLGLARGKTLILDDMQEMDYVCDLLIHTAAAGRSRAVDRYAASARFAPRSDEALVLAAMRAARFSILVIERRHDTAGLVATDVFRRAAVWLVDIGLEASMPDGGLIATRIFAPDRFAMTAGVNVLFDLDMIEDIYAELPRRLGKSELTALVDDWRFAEAIYRVALASGLMDRIIHQDPPGDA